MSPHLDPQTPYVVQLLLPSEATLDAPRLAESLRRVEPTARLLSQAPLTFALGDEVATFALQPGLAHPGEVEAALSQTWDWPDAERTTRAARATLVLSLDGQPDRHAKLRRLHALIHAAAEQLAFSALHWLPSQRLVEPQRWRESVHHGAPPGDHAINVRLFKVPDGRPGEAILDTMGLTALGLRDLQCHFAGLDLGAVAMLLLSYAEYLFEQGDVLGDTSLVRGLKSHEEWECHLERALAAPDREVVDLRPGPAAILR